MKSLRLMSILLFAGLMLLAGAPHPAQPVEAAGKSAATPAVASGLLFGATTAGPLSPSQFYSVDPATGAATLIGPIGFKAVSAMDFNPATGVLYATGRRNSGTALVLITINPATGAGTEIGPLIGSFNVQDMSFRNSDTTLFAYREGTLITLNLTTGAQTVIGSSIIFPFGNGMAFSPTDILYYANESILGTINQATGAVTPVTPLHYPPGLGLPRVSAMDFRPGTSTLYGTVITNSGQAFLATIDTATGDVSFIGRTADRMDALAWSGGSFDTCIRNDRSATYLSFNSTTGDYLFMDCSKGTTLSGRGSLSRDACKLFLTDSGPDPKRPDRGVAALVNTCTHVADVTVQFLPSGAHFTIHDSDTTNSACVCQ